MTKAETLFHEIAGQIHNTTEDKMFGVLCIKAPNGKAAVMFWKDSMIFKLEGTAEQGAMSLDGANFFDPVGGPVHEGLGTVVL